MTYTDFDISIRCTNPEELIKLSEQDLVRLRHKLSLVAAFAARLSGALSETLDSPELTLDEVMTKAEGHVVSAAALGLLQHNSYLAYKVMLNKEVDAGIKGGGSESAHETLT